ncbi:MAG TPA: GPW/gp25 family protein [Methylomusa anaerophila]|uniref:Gene 25-like lysozyme n=1 Tax=Methylomusa anaerophila TaxID=1930071 RepID=A0A348AJ14_9FIRM|nr:GPW/gp25 family protein [Methylomusa anaerophila]BBB91062.1 gene 25-like lysozyme [Methylomusa anaerophila]HML88937.1 GPW/gp25 family protein [Methylomusa anaerophila]
MEIEISALTVPTEIDFAPTTELQEIIQNVRTILTTPIYSVPLDRNFGVNAEMLDLPIPVAQARLSAEIVTAIQKYEPRVEVTEVSFTGDGMDGVLQPTVKLRIRE